MSLSTCPPHGRAKLGHGIRLGVDGSALKRAGVERPAKVSTDIVESDYALYDWLVEARGNILSYDLLCVLRFTQNLNVSLLTGGGASTILYPVDKNACRWCLRSRIPTRPFQPKRHELLPKIPRPRTRTNTIPYGTEASAAG